MRANAAESRELDRRAVILPYPDRGRQGMLASMGTSTYGRTVGWQGSRMAVGLFAAAIGVMGVMTALARTKPDGTPVIAPDALLTTPVGGLERTAARSEVFSVDGLPFKKALRVVIGRDAPDTNATQLTIVNTARVERGDVMLASFHIRGQATAGKSTSDRKTGVSPAQVMFLFERATSPWTKSASYSATAPTAPDRWRPVHVPFRAAESYAPGQAMVSLRFAFGPQTVEIGGLDVRNFGKSRTLEDVIGMASADSPIGTVNIGLVLSRKAQTMVGFGGNFCQPRYGSTEPMDAVGRFNLERLTVAHARVGIPLNWWAPEPGVYKDEAQAHASFLLMQDLSRRRIPIVGSVWEGPAWMLGGSREQMGRTLQPDKYDACIEAIGQYLVTARDRYGVTVEHFSFNEPDIGVNFKFTSAQMAAFIGRAGPRFRALGLKTTFLVGDTANGMATVDYCRPLLTDKALAPYLGPVAFHCWDALSAPDKQYAAIAELGRQFRKPVWCLEAGHDAQLWQQPDPWQSWENALRTALAYERTLRLTGATIMDYWTYQDNYPLVSKDGKTPYPVFHVMAQMENVFRRGSTVIGCTTDNEEVRALATVGPAEGQRALLLVNPSGPGKTVVRGFRAGAAVRMETSVSSAQRRAVTAKVGANGTLSVDVPARSVVTVVQAE